MDQLSDSACRWIFAHEFSRRFQARDGSIVIEGRPYTRTDGNEHGEALAKNVHEDAADRFSLEWGFDCELIVLSRGQISAQSANCRALAPPRDLLAERCSRLRLRNPKDFE